MVDTRPRFAARAVGWVVAVQVAVLTALSARYGFHRDELYFIAAGDRPDWGYVDQPPVTPLLVRLSTELFGDTPMGVRVIATLLGAAMVVVAAVTTALSSFVVVVSHMFATTTVDMVLWALLVLFALRLFRTGDGRWWLAVGATVGVGMANKWLILLLVFAIGVGLLVLGPRSVLRTWWLAAGVGVALVLAAPILIWQAAHDFPMLTVASGISEDDGVENRILFVPMQLVYVSPLFVPVWVAGIVRLLRDPDVRFARALGLSYPVLCVVLLALGGKPYYSVPLLVLMTAAGAEPALRWLDRRSRRWFAAVGVVITAVIFTSSYGQAGAIERYHEELGLPTPYSGHMSYADWGPPADTKSGAVVLVGEFDAAAAARFFAGCERVTEFDKGVDLDNEEQGTDIRLCSGPVESWSRMWPHLRHYY